MSVEPELLEEVSKVGNGKVEIKMSPEQAEALAIHQTMKGLSRTKQKELRRRQPRSQKSKWFLR